MNSGAGNKNYIIDLMRFIAALWVALFHFNEPIIYINNSYRNFAKLGYLGVPIFFVISGYCILMSALNSKSAFDFLLRRFFRIFPAYWLSLLVVIFAAFIQKAAYGDNSVAHIPHNIFAGLCTVVLYTSPLSNIPTINWVYWSLSCEAAFYILIYIGLTLSRKHLIYFFIVISFTSLWINSPSGKIYFFLNHWSAFSLGLCIYYFHSSRIVVDKKLLLILLILNITGLFTHFLVDHPLQIAVAIMSGALIYFSNANSLKKNFFSKLGDFSYAVYLIHVPIGVYVLGYFKNNLFQQNQLLNIIFDITVYCIVTLFAILIYKYVEQPFIRIGKSFVKKDITNQFNVSEST